MPLCGDCKPTLLVTLYALCFVLVVFTGRVGLPLLIEGITKKMFFSRQEQYSIKGSNHPEYPDASCYFETTGTVNMLSLVDGLQIQGYRKINIEVIGDWYPVPFTETMSLAFTKEDSALDELLYCLGEGDTLIEMNLTK